MKCPNGCPPEDLEREDYGAFTARGIVDVLHRRADKYDPASAVYHCQACDWTAVWTEGQPLDVKFAGIGHDPYDPWQGET